MLIAYPGFVAAGRAAEERAPGGGAAFVGALLGAVDGLPITPVSLQTVIDFETAKTWRPDLKNPVSPAVGLLQWMPSSAVQVGTSSQALAKMSATEQLAYVRPSFSPKREALARVAQGDGFADVADVYLANWGPSYIAAPDDTVIAIAGSAVFEQNPFSKQNPAVLQVGDIRRAIRAYHEGSMERHGLFDETAPGALSFGVAGPTEARAGAGAGAVLLLVVGLGWALSRRRRAP